MRCMQVRIGGEVSDAVDICLQGYRFGSGLSAAVHSPIIGTVSRHLVVVLLGDLAGS
jgi:hypothetical protein